MKKTLFITVIIIIMFIGSIAYADELTYSDVKETDWFYTYVNNAVKAGAVVGYPDGTYLPNKAVTKGEFIKIIVASVVDKTVGVNTTEGKHWATDYYTVALENQLIDIQETTLDKLDEQCTREEMAYILSKITSNVLKEETANIVGVQALVKDYENIKSKYQLSVTDTYARGLIGGDDNGNFSPKKSMTRAEVATVLTRILYKEQRIKVEAGVNQAPIENKIELRDLPPVDLSHLYDYPTLFGISVEEENKTYYQYGEDFMETIVNDVKNYMELTHNRDYMTINKSEKYKSDLLYYLNGYKEYKGIEYYGVRSYYLEGETDPAYIEYVNNKNDFIDNFLNQWVKDTVDNKVNVEAEFYTNKDLLIYSDNSNAVRGTLRIKYNNHNNISNIKEELDLIEREGHAKGQRITGLDKSEYNKVYMKFEDIPKFEVGKIYEIDMDVIVIHTSTAKGVEDRSKRSYRYIYPIAVREIQ